MAVVIASALDKDVAGAPLFRGVSFKLERGDRMTLAGRNGAGKTTLLRMVAGQIGVDGGELAFEKGTRAALHDQRPPRERGLSLRDYVLAGCSDLVALEKRLRELEDDMAARPDDKGTLRRYASTQSRLEHAGGWNWRTRALAPLHGLGFADAQLDRPLERFSGGELTRASLARALAGDPDLLLLDEPTNHLDISSLEWLEGYLTTLDAAVILVAHDRWFLEAVGTSVLELEAGRGRFFPGSWHAWRRELAAREIALGKAIEKQQREIERMERFVERFRYKATKARQAQSRVKRLEKMERIERDPRDTRSLGFSFGTAERTGRVVLEIDDARLEVPGRTLLEDGELWLERGEHISLVGPNGAGKTTLIEALAGRRPLDGGRLRVGHNVNIGYLYPACRRARHARHRTRGGPARNRTDPEPGAGPAGPLPVLGRGGREADGGAVRRRAASPLARRAGVVRGERPDPRRADEPPRPRRARGARGRAAGLRRVRAPRVARPGSARRRRQPHGGLRGGPPAQLRGRLGRVRAGARGTARGGRGGRGAASRSAGRRGGRADRGEPSGNGASRRQRSGPSKNEQRRIAELEREVERAESALRRLEDELADPGMWSSPSRTERNTARHAKARRAVEEAYARWEQASSPDTTS